MVAVAGIQPTEAMSSHHAAAVVVGGAMAIWIAHAYAGLMGHRVSSGHRLGPKAFAEALRSAWPVVTAGGIIALPLVGSGLGVYGLASALDACNLVGVLILASVGWAAARTSGAGWGRTAVLVGLSCGLGLLVVVIERLVHH
jgi:hypothetical protein